jgi:hypothetical protein
MVLGITIIIFVSVVGFFILKPLVGYMALRRNPISAGQAYLKRLVCDISPSNAVLIPDDAYKQLAGKAFQFAELSHTAERQSLIGCYMSSLDFYAKQIQFIMTGEETDWEGPVAEVLKLHGVQYQKPLRQ